MLLRDYERAKTAARDCTDEALQARLARLDRLALHAALIGCASILILLFGTPALEAIAPGFDRAHPLLDLLLTIYLPATGIIVFFFGGEALKRRRDVVYLAQRLKKEASEQGGQHA